MTNDAEIPGDDEIQQLRTLFNRSPHPYHQPGLASSNRLILNRSKSSSLQDVRRELFGLSLPDVSNISATSQSDSGTEADDEKPLLKALTAPPARPRKGLKDTVSNDGHISSPSISSGHERDIPTAGRAPSERRKGRNSERDNSQVVSSGFEARRRLFELVLFAIVGWVSLLGTDHQAKTTFWCHVATVLSIYSARISWLTTKLYYRNGRNWTRLWFPASADPAPLIYPVFLPLLIAYSVAAGKEDNLIGYVLSFCAVPNYVIPFRDPSVQWLLSLLPLIYQNVLSGSSSSVTDMSREEIVLLFPLHSALLHVLYFLTTTSLLEAELQLLSIALINLLGAPRTPQSSILKALLWIGGLSVLLSCRHVLKLSVELARIPTWRLRRTNRPRGNHSVIYCALDDTLGGFLSQRVFPKRSTYSSDEEDIHPNLSSRGSRVKRNLVRISSQRQAMDDLQYPRHSSTFFEGRERFNMNVKQRRHTFSGNLATLPDIPAITRTATNALSSAKVRSRLILKLTLPQATVLKWMYSVFIYLTIVLIILAPIRLYVQYFALNGHEPVGWALGYLLGDYQPFRFYTVMHSLDNWICLPSRDLMDFDFSGTAEYFRQATIGAANTRLMICAYCLLVIVLGLAVVIHLSNVVEVDTRRKVFHGMMVVMFLPTIFIDPTFVALAFTLILAIFLLLDLFRASQLPPLSKPLTYFLAPYVDGRDHKGPIVISHIFLLIGCAVPLWLSLAGMERSGTGPLIGWEVPVRDLSMVTGVICVGMGDAAASLIGRRYGRRRWPWTGGKSLEGSAAFAFSVFIGLAASRIWLTIGGWSGTSDDSWALFSLKATMAAVGASLTEAVLTGGNDNVVVPVILWLLTRGMTI